MLDRADRAPEKGLVGDDVVRFLPCCYWPVT